MNPEAKPLQVGVKALLRDARGRFLLLHRSAAKYPDVRDNWDIPGGRIHPGKSLLENLGREIAEETGITTLGTPRLVAAQDIIREDKHVVRLTYAAEARGNVILDKEENDDFRWVTKKELSEMSNLDQYVRAIINSL